MKTTALAIFLCLLSGCAEQPVTLRHPQTGEIKRCKNIGWLGLSGVAAQGNCVSMRESEGYVIVEDPRPAPD
jgi:hypothetical protein